LFEGPERNEALRLSLAEREARHPGVLHRFLRKFDPVAAYRIHTNDVQKLVRALEVILVAGQPLSRMFETGRDRLTGYRILRIGLDPPRDRLYERINQRTRAMFENGLLEEVQRLLAGGAPPDAKPFESIGYSQALKHLRGELSLEAAIESTQMATRRYAKRQLTWFRREESVFWIKDFGETPESAALAISRIKEGA
jgi:tRNA dimethylallyltransferase